MTAPFVVLSLPRSRSYWTSRFLTYGGWTCSHDEARYVRGVDDVTAWLSQDMVGSCETAVAPFWRLIRQIRPDTRIAVIRRPVADVIKSLLATGIEFDHVALVRHMNKLDRKLDYIERSVPNVLSVSYADMSREAGCARLFEHCLGVAHDRAWWKRLAQKNLQINLQALCRYQRAYAARLRAAEVACVRRINATMFGEKVRHGEQDERGVTIQEEGFAAFLRDGTDLFREHCLAVGDVEDEWTRKNIPVLLKLDDDGYCQTMTARSNGRMLAYLMTLVGPSLEAVGRTTATQTLFFSSKDALGMNLGEALQQASIERLRRKGVHEVIMREGVRGSGPKLGVLYRRLGAEPFGNLHRLQLESV